MGTVHTIVQCFYHMQQLSHHEELSYQLSLNILSTLTNPPNFDKSEK